MRERRGVRRARRERRQRDRRVGRRAAPAASCTTRPSCRASARAAARTSRSRHEDLPLVGGAIVPAGGGRSIFALPWLGHTLVGTTDNDYEGAARAHPPVRATTSTTCSTRSTTFFGTALGARRPDGRVRRRAPADLDRRPEEVGRHLAQGRAVRDLLGDDHDHRRQAHDVAADGEDDRRPARRARRARRAVPHARDPARPGDRASRSCRASRACPRTSYARARRPATATPPTTCSRSPPSAASWRSRSSPGCPDLLAEVALAARREQARSDRRRAAAPHAPRPARAARELTRRRPPAIGDSGPVARVADILARELGWDDARLALELRRFAEEARGGGHRRRGRTCRGPSRKTPPPRRRRRAVNAPGTPLRAGDAHARAGARLVASPDGDRQRLAGLLQRRRRCTPSSDSQVRARRASCSRPAPTSSTSAASRRPPGRPPVARRGGDRARRAAGRARRRRARRGRLGRHLQAGRRARRDRRRGAASSTTSAACATPSSPTSARRRARRSW